MKSIKEIAQSDRPRETLLREGAPRLSDADLLTLILGSGIKGCGVAEVSKHLLNILDSKGCNARVQDLETITGIGFAKACLIVAALEFSRRRIRPEGIKIRKAADVLPLIGYLADKKQEHFLVLSLNGAHEVMATEVVTIGLLNFCQVHPREVFSAPIEKRAAAIIIAHNHPSGSLNPSEEDRTITKRLIAAGEILGIKILDHIIFSRNGYYSFLEEGVI